jgi:hypothetical protein
MKFSAESIYVLRLWHEPGADEARGWRVSLFCTATGERQYFASPAALVTFLQRAQRADELSALWRDEPG